MSEYLIIIEQEGASWGAYAPDLPGLGIVGSTRDEVERLVKEAVTGHIAMLREHGEPVPEPTAKVAYVAVA